MLDPTVSHHEDEVVEVAQPKPIAKPMAKTMAKPASRTAAKAKARLATTPVNKPADQPAASPATIQAAPKKAPQAASKVAPAATAAPASASAATLAQIEPRIEPRFKTIWQPVNGQPFTPPDLEQMLELKKKKPPSPSTKAATPAHGTSSRYRQGCRCDGCREAKREYDREHRLKRAEREREALAQQEARRQDDILRVSARYRRLYLAG